MSTRPVDIIRRSDNALVEATLVDTVEASDLIVIERAWAVERARLIGRLRSAGVPTREWPESWHWNWAAKSRELSTLAAAGFGILWEKDWQAVILVKTAPYVARLAPDKGKPLVYVDYIEGAPWNWTLPKIGQDGLFKGYGSILMREAVKYAQAEEFAGRVGLHSLPQAEAFYGDICGMSELGRDPSKQNLRYFEFSREQAEDFLRKGGE